MRLSLLPAIALLSLATPVLAQTQEEVIDRIETIHGDSDLFLEAFDNLQQAFADGDLELIAGMGLYPMHVRVGEDEYEVESAEDYLAGADASVTPELQELVANQDIANLIVSSEGVGFDEGALWMTNVCLDNACAETRWGILAINN